MRKLFGLAFLSLLFSACASPSEAWCAQQESCDLLGKKSADQCSADAEKRIDDARAKGDAECDRLAEKYESLLSCEASLSCAELGLDTKSSPCRDENEAFAAALLGALSCAW